MKVYCKKKFKNFVINKGHSKEHDNSYNCTGNCIMMKILGLDGKKCINARKVKLDKINKK